jgi:hypothetical protein
MAAHDIEGATPPVMIHAESPEELAGQIRRFLVPGADT